jgi:hypothetical protein
MTHIIVDPTHVYWAQAQANPRLRDGEPHAIVRAKGAGGAP